MASGLRPAPHRRPAGADGRRAVLAGAGGGAQPRGAARQRGGARGELLENTRKLIAGRPGAGGRPRAARGEPGRRGVGPHRRRARPLRRSAQDLGREIGLDAGGDRGPPLPVRSLPGRPARGGAAGRGGAGRFIDAGPAPPRRPGGRAAAADRARPPAPAPPRTRSSRSSTWSSRPATPGSPAAAAPASFFSPLYRNVPGAGALGLPGALVAHLQPARPRRPPADSTPPAGRTPWPSTWWPRGSARTSPRRSTPWAATPSSSQGPREAVRLFERTVANEEKKLKGGTSTLLDLITQRDRLIAARQTEVAAELALALSLLELRFQTGTLLGERRTGGGGRGRAPDHPALPPGGRRRDLPQGGAGAALLARAARPDGAGHRSQGVAGARRPRRPPPRRHRLGDLRLDPHRGAGGRASCSARAASPTSSPTPPARSRRCWSASAT